MRSEQTDYILRLIEQLGAALRRARDLLGLGVSGAQEASDTLQAAEDELLGERAGILRDLDADTAVALVGHPRKLALWGELTRARGEALRLLGRTPEAEELERRADQLQSAALKR